MNPDDRALAVAARIADGSEIDWPAVASATADPDRREVLEELRAIAAVATLHRAPADWPPGTGPSSERRWGPLTLLATIGRGRFGDVHLAWDARLERRVALKRLHVASPPTSAIPTQAIEEARLLARVRHPNVLSVYGAECIDDEVGIWTEYIEGRTLEAIVTEDGPLPPADVIRIGIDLARALAAVHEAGLLHRDVKAQNVMRETGGRIVLMDFGAGHDLAAVPPKAGDLTGTPLYLAPEIFAGGWATVSSDLYALGVLLFRLLTGRYPVEGRTLEDVRVGHERNGARNLGVVQPDLPAALVGVVERALATNPSDRYAAARAFEAALTNVGRALEVTNESTVVADRPGGRSRYFGGLTFSTALTAGAVVAAALFALALGVVGRPGDWFGRGLPRPGVPAADSASMSVREIASFPTFRLIGTPSHDGRYLPFVDQAGDVAIWETATGRSQRVTNHGDSVELGEGTVLSPDARQVAYSWYATTGLYELRVANVDGTSPRRLLASEAFDYVVLMEWSRDGRYLLCLLPQTDGVTHLALVPVDGTAPTMVQTFRTGMPRRASLSGDNRLVVYDLPNASKAGRRDVWIAGIDGSPARVLLDDRANNLMPFWTVDGSRVFFVSDRSGSMDGWVVPVTNGVAAGEPTVVAQSLGRVVPLGLTADGRYYYRLQTNDHDVYVVPIDLSGASPPGTPRRVSSVVGGHIGPGWSPDGRFISYISTSGDAAFSRNVNTLTIQDVRTEQERDVAIPVTSLGVGAPQWSPDGRRLLLRATGYENLPGYFQVDVATGHPTPALLWNESRATEQGRFSWSADGRGMFYMHRPRGIIVRDLASGRETVLVPNPPGSAIGSFAASPDGTTIAFGATTQATSGQSTTIYSQVTGQVPRSIYSVSGRERLILQAWTPDAPGVLVTRFTQGSSAPHQVWKITMDGAAYDLGVSVATNTQPNRLALSPDGRQLAYTEGVVSWELWVMENFLPMP